MFIKCILNKENYTASYFNAPKITLLNMNFIVWCNMARIISLPLNQMY